MGLGNYKAKSWSKADAKGRRTLVEQRIRDTAKEDRHISAEGLASHGQWMQWDQALERSLSWKERWSADQGKLTFLLHAVNDLLPTPNNLKIRGKDEDPSCHQCGAALCTLNHILTGCPKAMEGRYRWRLDKVLVEIAKWTDLQRIKANEHKTPPTDRGFSFPKQEERFPKSRRTDSSAPSILYRGSNWEMQVDLKKKLVFPDKGVVTTLRPNMVLLSRSTKTIIVVELTVPWEGRLAISHEFKKAKYQDLIDEASIKGWNGALFPIEVGCRGFPATSVHYFLKKIGFESKRQRKATGEIAAAAESLRGYSR